MADPYGGSEDKLTNNKINLIIFQQAAQKKWDK
jgi:hypothetical protein